MWSALYLRRIDLRQIVIILLLMGISLLIISSYSYDLQVEKIPDFFSNKLVQVQIKSFFIGWCCFFFFAGLDYKVLQTWAPVIYVACILSLIGLFFSDPIQRVHRWYRVPFINHNIQPSEYAKLALVITLSWYLERRSFATRRMSTALGGLALAMVPFILILKQPDLGSSLVLFPIVLVMFYFGDLRKSIVRLLSFIGTFGLVIVFLFFSGIVSHEEAKPIALNFIKEYQYERLNPETHHQKAASTAIAIGGVTGVGWHSSEYSKGGSLPAPFTDSVFCAFGEEFGFLGLLFVLVLFYSLVYCSFQVTCVAQDLFGRLLAAGISVLIAVHVCVNTGMMCGLLPITGVPLLLITYGGSSVISTMIALGILQSIYARRFMF